MKFNFNLKKIATLLLICFIVMAGLDIGNGILFWHKYSQATAAGACPISEGGMVSKYTPLCVLDTPVVAPTTCAISCPLVTANVGTACVGYSELAIAGQMGNIVIGIPVGFANMTGMPKTGQFLACLASPMAPIALGFPTGSAMRVQKLVKILTFLHLM
ncbi:MAG: hypothetical protein WCG01_02520 [bacterium]